MPDKPEPHKMPWMAWVVVTLIGAAIPVTPQIVQLVQGHSSGPVQPASPAPPSPPVAPTPAPKPPAAPVLTAQDWFKRGMNHQQAGQYQAAIEAFKRVLTSTDATRTRTCTKCTLQHKAESEAALGLFEDAAQSYEAAAEHAQSPEEYSYYQAQAYEMSMR